MGGTDNKYILLKKCHEGTWGTFVSLTHACDFRDIAGGHGQRLSGGLAVLLLLWWAVAEALAHRPARPPVLLT